MIRRDDDDVRFVQDTYTFCFRANPSLLLLFNGACLSEKQQVSILYSLVLLEPMIYHSQCEHDLPQSMRARSTTVDASTIYHSRCEHTNHYTTERTES
jgi:hypothetical protein